MLGIPRTSKPSLLRPLTRRYGMCPLSIEYTRMLSLLRIWDVENKRKQKTVIVVKSKERGARTKVLTCGYSPDGGIIGGGTSRYTYYYPIPQAAHLSREACFDGALHMWQARSNFARPNMTVEGAHMKNSETGSVVFSVDGRTVVTRGGDDTVKSM